MRTDEHTVVSDSHVRSYIDVGDPLAIIGSSSLLNTILKQLERDKASVTLEEHEVLQKTEASIKSVLEALPGNAKELEGEDDGAKSAGKTPEGEVEKEVAELAESS